MILPSAPLINAATLQAILDEILSPRLEQMGLTRSASYTWQDQSTKDIRRGFSYEHLKGGTGTFRWGVNLTFLPFVTNGKIVYHKSAKKYVHHLFEWPDEYENSFLGGNLDGGITTHWGQSEARKSINRLFSKYEKRIAAWFDKTTSFENLIDIAEMQTNNKDFYKIHSPNPQYVLAFLMAKTNQVDAALKQFDSLGAYELDMNPDLKEKLKTKLITLSENG